MRTRITDRRLLPGFFLTMAFVAALSLAPATAPSGATAAHADPVAIQIDVGGSGDDGFLADSYVTGGLTDTKPADRTSLPNWTRGVPHPVPAGIWHSSRFLESSYTVPGLAPGNYEVRLYFMDWYFTRVGQRVFDVAVNGAKVLPDFDIIGTAVTLGADGQAAFGIERDIPVTVDDSGTVRIDFIRGRANQPQVNAIVIAPAA